MSELYKVGTLPTGAIVQRVIGGCKYRICGEETKLGGIKVYRGEGIVVLAKVDHAKEAYVQAVLASAKYYWLKGEKKESKKVVVLTDKQKEIVACLTAHGVQGSRYKVVLSYPYGPGHANVKGISVYDGIYAECAVSVASAKLAANDKARVEYYVDEVKVSLPPLGVVLKAPASRYYPVQGVMVSSNIFQEF